MTINTFTSLRGLIVALTLVVVLTGCSAKKSQQDQQALQPAMHPVSQVVKPDVEYTIDAYDPWEGFNRSMYKFNYYFDTYFYLPVVGTYETVMPDFLENMVSSFFKNIGEVKNLSNAILQLKPSTTVKTTGRIIINTTIGLGGLFDPATSFGIARQNDDFGQTLGRYGVGAGPYLVLPILGPSTLRDTTGLVVDTAARTALMNGIDPFENASHQDGIEGGINGLEAIDARHIQSFRYYESGSPFEYDLIRLLYLKKRGLDVAK